MDVFLVVAFGTLKLGLVRFGLVEGISVLMERFRSMVTVFLVNFYYVDCIGIESP